MANKNSSSEVDAFQVEVKQSILDIINDKNCFLYSVTYADLSHDGAEQTLSIKYIIHPEDKTDSFEDAMAVVD